MCLGLSAADVGVRQRSGPSCTNAGPGPLNALGEIRQDQKEFLKHISSSFSRSKACIYTFTNNK